MAAPSASAIKCLLEYAPSDAGRALGATEATSLSVKLPRSWSAQPVAKVLELFLESYAKKLAASASTASAASAAAYGASADAPAPAPAPLRAADFHIVAADGRALCSARDVLQEHVRSGDVLRVCAGAGPQEPTAAAGAPPGAAGAGAASAAAAAASASASAAGDASLLQCRNYGCAQKFRVAENGPGACRHHAQPPLFHDTRKGWQCCRERMAYDWDDFAKIPGCVASPHSAEPPAQLFAKSPSALAAEAADAADAAAAAARAAAGGGGGAGGAAAARAAAAPSSSAAASAPKSIDAYNAANPLAATAAASAARTVLTRPKARRRAEDGRVFCVRKGCGAWFALDAPAGAEPPCVHHPGAPVFHDASRRWGCCAKTAYEFEDFVKLPGCATAAEHDAGDTSAL